MMKIWNVITVLICLIVSLISCVPRRNKSDTTQKFHRTGEAIAIDKLVHQFENEHQILYKGEATQSDYLEWPALDNKDLSIYCIQYLQHIVPSRTNAGAIGIKMRAKLHYNFKNTRNISEIVIVQCKIYYKSHRTIYYMTRALELNCVYALKSSGHCRNYIFTIIHKYCNIENNQLIVRSLKWKRMDIIDRINHATGQPIAKDEYLMEYELEHQEMLKKEEEGNYMEWPALNNKDLTKYCRQYLQHIIPFRKNNFAIGVKMIKTVHYQNTSIINNIVIVQCKTWYKTHKTSYYMMRALEPNCVYALKCSKDRRNYIFSIIHKHCDFEDQPLRNRSLKLMVTFIDRIHRNSGQPIAKDEYLLKYELEHQQMYKKGESESIQWHYGKEHANLNLYCYQYMRESCPGRNRGGVTGCLYIQKLRYQKLNTNKDIDVTTITCLLPYASQKRYYHMIKAPEINCVYAVIRNGRVHHSLVIIFKHCDFEDSPNDQLTIPYKNRFPKTEIKEETFDTLPLYL